MCGSVHVYVAYSLGLVWLRRISATDQHDPLRESYNLCIQHVVENDMVECQIPGSLRTPCIVLELESSLCIYIIASSCGRSNYRYVHARVTNKKVQMVSMDYHTVDSSQYDGRNWAQDEYCGIPLVKT